MCCQHKLSTNLASFAIIWKHMLNTKSKLFIFAIFFPGMPSVGGAKAAPDDYYLSDDDYYNDDDNYDLSPDEKVVHTTPTFVSTSSSQLVNEGDTIKLPCFVDNLGKKNCL